MTFFTMFQILYNDIIAKNKSNVYYQDYKTWDYITYHLYLLINLKSYILHLHFFTI